MRFRNSLAVFFLGLGCAVAARAQAGVYVGYTATQLRGITCFETAPINCTNGAAGGTVEADGSINYQGTGVVNPAGVQVGAYYDFHTFGPMRFGVDLRGGDFHSNKSATSSAGGKNATGLDYFLAGARGSFHTHYSWLSPYVQISAGYARSNATLPFGLSEDLASITPPRIEDNFLMYEGFAGIDVHVFPYIDLRPIELGIGNMNRFGGGGAGDGPSSVGVRSIGASIVFHMPSSR